MNLPAGITIISSITPGAWGVVDVRQLTGEQNANKHNLYVNVLTDDGRRERNPNLRIGWSWLGRRADEQAPLVALDKPDGPMEQGHGNIPIQPRQSINVWIEGDGAGSDNVFGFRTTEPPANDPGNTWGHVSYVVTFRRKVVGTPVEPTDPTDVGSTLEARVVALEAWRGRVAAACLPCLPHCLPCLPHCLPAGRAGSAAGRAGSAAGRAVIA